MKILANSKILNLYQANSRGIEYSLDQLFNSILIESAKQSLRFITSFSLEGENIPYDISDEIYARIMEYGDKSLSTEQNTNLFLLTAYLFPEV